MTTHIVCHVGPDDDYSPAQSDDATVHYFSVEASVAEDAFRERVLDQVFDTVGREPAPQAVDLLYLAFLVQTADLVASRDANADGWTRNLHLHLAVADVELWEGVRVRLCSLLSFLSGDGWTLHFRQRDDVAATDEPAEAYVDCDCVCLFSGGLDSFCGAVSLLEAERFPLLVGHYAAGVVHSDQERALNELAEHYPHTIEHLFCFADVPVAIDASREKSRRSRSFLFVCLGVVVASALGAETPLVVAENGFISLNVPATPSRIGSQSTRTTHPHVIQLLRELFDALGLPHPLETPFAFFTKGEMVRDYCVSLGIGHSARETNSCAHPEASRWEGESPTTPCGYCVPCLIRRAAFHAADCPENEYLVDVLAETLAPDSGRGQDLRAMQMLVGRFREERALFDVLSSGPLEPQLATQYADVYRRGVAELKAFLALVG